MKPYRTPDGDTFYLNLTEGPVLLRAIDLDMFADLLRQFRERQFAWAVDLLCSISEKRKDDGGSTLVTGLAGQKKAGKPLLSWRLRLTSFPDEAWLAAGVTCKTFQERADHILTMTLDEQRLLVRAACGSKIEDLEAIVCTNRRHELTHLVIENDLRASRSAMEFIDLLYRRLLDEVEVLSRTNARFRGVEGELTTVRRSSIVKCFFLFLAEQRVALLPFPAKALPGRTKGLEDYLFKDETRSLSLLHRELLAASFANRIAEAKARYVTRDRIAFLFTFFLVTDYRGSEQIEGALFDELHAAATAMPNAETRTSAMRFIQRVIINKLTGKLPNASLFNRKVGYHGRFAWTQMERDASTEKHFPENVPSGYKPQANILAWVDRLTDEIKHLQTKDVHNHLVAFSTFVIWLAWSGNPASDICELSREDINDGLDHHQSKCFRAFITRKNISEQNSTTIMSRMAAFCDRRIAVQRLNVANPFNMRFDAFKGKIRRGKTPRLPLGREMMEYIRDFNNQDAFAFSKSLKSNYRLVRHGRTNEMASVWYPAFAIMIDFLLRIPIRSFQIRYLDSGEGDEYLPSFGSTLTYLPNRSALATKDRREFALAIIDGIEKNQILGLYINTNKTSVDRDGGYEIPWCDHSIKDNLMLMRAWQMQYNPIDEPIPCIDRERYPENRDVIASVQKAYPLFRDPAEPGSFPPSRAVLRQYWDELLWAVENELRQSGSNIRLTEERRLDNRRTEYVTHIALFDIHTLRVSGITALIEAGLPPDLVMNVAGHSTVVMTMYYNRVSASRLNARLRQYMERADDLLTGEGDERFESHLINTRAEEDCIGLTMLQSAGGRSGASVEVMFHGICPGGDCSTGGEWTNQAVGYVAVPRPRACSLCRYRLTGPMFLLGLVCNVNRLMHEYSAKGQEIVALNEKISANGGGASRMHAERAQVSALYRDVEVIGREWAAEMTYVKKAEASLESFMANSVPDTGFAQESTLPIFAGEPYAEVETRLEGKSQFALLQSLSDGAANWIGFRPSAALIDHREFLNEIMEQGDLRPFLLSLSGAARDAAANMLGRVISTLVPDEEIDGLRTGSKHLSAYPTVLSALLAIERDALALGPSVVPRLVEEVAS